MCWAYWWVWARSMSAKLPTKSVGTLAAWLGVLWAIDEGLGEMKKSWEVEAETVGPTVADPLWQCMFLALSDYGKRSPWVHSKDRLISPASFCPWSLILPILPSDASEHYDGTSEWLRR